MSQKGLVITMTIEDMFGDLHKIDILAEKPEQKEVLMDSRLQRFH